MVDEFLRREIDVGSFPSASYAIGTVDGVEQAGALGHAVVVPVRIPATPQTIYDLASTTKVLVTGILILQAVAEGRIGLDDEYRGYTYRELLTHTSGLRPWIPTYAYPDVLAAIEEHGPERPRGGEPVYSDLNFFLLYFALQEIFGDYRTAARARIFDRLGLRDTQFNPRESLRPRIAATEWGQRWEVVMCAERSVPFRDFREGPIWGETHDGNSFHAGGTLGNAGLFATAGDVFRIAQVFARGELVPRALVEESAREQANGRGLAWQVSGPGLSPESFGHMGFTGTSVWIDGPRIYVLLTNRVHPCAAPIAMRAIRGEFHRLAAETLTAR